MAFQFRTNFKMIKFVLLFLLIITLLIKYRVDNELTQPYMDEIFHFSQALNYFKGIYSEWNPKITTPPGLYIATNLIYVPLSKVTGIDFGKLEWFRSTNIFFLIGFAIIMYLCRNLPIIAIERFGLYLKGEPTPYYYCIDGSNQCCIFCQIWNPYMLNERDDSIDDVALAA